MAPDFLIPTIYFTVEFSNNYLFLNLIQYRFSLKKLERKTNYLNRLNRKKKKTVIWNKGNENLLHRYDAQELFWTQTTANWKKKQKPVDNVSQFKVS